MILALDCGNTHITVGTVSDNNTVENVFVIPTDKTETKFGYAVKLKQMLEIENINIKEIDGAALSSVVPPVTHALEKALEKLTGKFPLTVGAGVKTGLHICINDPGTVASDMVTAAVAAKEEYEVPCIVIDMGTATTVTVIDENSRFIGGAIYPGVNISLTSLAEKTALLPHIDIKPPCKTIGLNTVDCMKSGIVYGTAGAVDGLIDRFERELNGNVSCIVATGGISPLIIPYMRHHAILDKYLILKGLKLIWDKNVKSRYE